MALFEDQSRTVDFVLVYKNSRLDEDREEKLNKYIDNVINLGFDLEVSKFSVDEDVKFLKIHAPDEVVFNYSSVFDITLACRDFSYRPPVKYPRDFLSTPLTKPIPSTPGYNEVHPRAPEAFDDEIPKSITSSERILVSHQLLSRTRYGPDPGQFGFERLMNERILMDAFPLHDGPYKWTESGPLNHRQLLFKYWGNFKCWYKYQPINLINIYFGTEYALYFTWLGFYIQMLIPMACVAFIVFLYGLLTVSVKHLNVESPDVCNSDKIICPKCHYDKCKPRLLKQSCFDSYMTYVFDNPSTVAFAVVISIWSTVFMELFQRHQNVLQLQWNVSEMEKDFVIRAEFLEHAPKRYSSVTQQMEPYVPFHKKFSSYILTSVSVLVLLTIMVLAVLAVMIYRITVSIMLVRDAPNEKIEKNNEMIASITGAMMSATFIFLFKWIYVQIAVFLTNLESHRTQYQYDNSYIFKSYGLAFTNNYSAALYIAFFKGRFYTHPGDMALWTNFGGLWSNLCDPTGCISDLSILLIIILVFKAVASNFTQLLMPPLKVYVRSRRLIGLFKRKRWRMRRKDTRLPQWEIDYLLAPTNKFFIMDEYMDMVIQYGFVIFFVVAFPLTPLLALLNNLSELRVDARKVTASYRRPVPNRVVGLGAWFGILQAMTYIGLVTNGLIIAFTSDFVSKQIYKHDIDKSLKGYQASTLSLFNMSDFKYHSGKEPPFETCYYTARRYPPDHPEKYQNTREHFYDLAVRVAAVLIFEHLLATCKGFLAYAIPDIPFFVKQEQNRQAQEEKNIRLENLNAQYAKLQESMKKKSKK